MATFRPTFLLISKSARELHAGNVPKTQCGKDLNPGPSGLKHSAPATLALFANSTDVPVSLLSLDE